MSVVLGIVLSILALILVAVIGSLILFAIAAVFNAARYMEDRYHENITKRNKPDC